MATLADLKAELIRLEAAAAEIRSQGEAKVDPDFWLDSTHNGKTSKTYYRKRWFDSQGRKHSESLAKDAYDTLNESIKRGGQLQRVQQQIIQVVAKLDRIAQTAAELGLKVP